MKIWITASVECNWFFANLVCSQFELVIMCLRKIFFWLCPPFPQHTETRKTQTRRCIWTTTPLHYPFLHCSRTSNNKQHKVKIIQMRRSFVILSPGPGLFPISKLDARSIFVLWNCETVWNIISLRWEGGVWMIIFRRWSAGWSDFEPERISVTLYNFLNSLPLI